MGGIPFDGPLDAGRLVLLVASLAIALGFEFVNGFHDTANAVATVIYTRSLAPRKAVVWSGICNFIGVHLGGTAVAFSIVHLLPVDLLVSIGSGPGMAMVLALLIAATSWNLGTWYLGLPASSSHTLIGAVLGVGLANSALQGRGLGAGVNWGKALEVGAALLISPAIGFCAAALLMKLLRRTVEDPALFEPPAEGATPPRWIRAVLLGTCTGVSLAHGSNDGQKGVGLIMLILIGLLPARYALNPDYDARETDRVIRQAGRLEELLRRRAPADVPLDARISTTLEDLRRTLSRVARPSELGRDERWRVRSEILRIDGELGRVASRLDRSDPARRTIEGCRAGLRRATDFAPTWVTVAVACALGMGTMVGWKRIVVTVGERIGKAHLTYAQGASAEVVAMTTIGLADFGGLPVSTTHVLSSAVAGTMVAERHGLQYRTVWAIALAWVLTLPSSMALSGTLFVTLRGLLA
jgi:PiT family inorganic phosphate transporter